MGKILGFTIRFVLCAALTAPVFTESKILLNIANFVWFLDLVVAFLWLTIMTIYFFNKEAEDKIIKIAKTEGLSYSLLMTIIAHAVAGNYFLATSFLLTNWFVLSVKNKEQ